MLILMCLMISLLLLIGLCMGIRSLVRTPDWKTDYDSLIKSNY
jgi:F0F1-type ATP synthase assembly protein I